MTDQRLIIVSNRLPVVLSRGRGGDWTLERGSGGLITAVEPVLRRRGGVWVGWPGTDVEKVPELDRLLERAVGEVGYHVHGVALTPEERDDFYLGFSNQVVWPLFHDFQTQCNFDPAFWQAYRKVNRKFTDAVGEIAREGDFLWIHDYHLMAMATELRRRGIHQDVGFFLHIPFPPFDLFTKLPWRYEILDSLLSFDLLGFQTSRDRRNFLDCLVSMVPDAELEGEGRVVKVRQGPRRVGIGVFPVSIPFQEFADTAGSDEVEERVAELRSEMPGQRILLGVDRLDYSKGIPHKLQGFRLALRRHPDLVGRVTLIQLVVPSREDIPEYHRMKTEIERLVGEIQGEFTRAGWVPIHYQYGRWERPELVAHYRAADAALVTPLKDGMNLVAKEYCASSLDDEGVLIMSEYAGAAAQFEDDALLVNPYDVEAVAEAIHTAFTLEGAEVRRRMGALRDRVRRRDVSWWVDTFLKAAREEDLGPDAGVESFRLRPPAGFGEAEGIP